ncbi:MAG: hypothetical protein PUH53_02350 [Mycoplasma sp.]|nr:hypothetical protein [Mycoplasma sp.]MDY4618443.1 hypothetical protein [Bacilli bacterium]
MKKSEKLKNVVDKKVTEVKDTDIRFDKTKDYIYYSDVNVVEGELDIEYKNININFEDKDGVAAIVNKENEEMSKSPVYDETNEEANYNHLISAKFAKYEIIHYVDYITLVVNKYSFDYKTIITTLGSDVYVFDKTSGKLYNNDELLSKFSINKDDINEKVKTYLNDKNLVSEENKIDVEKTISNNTKYNLYVDKLGRLVISILVKAEKSDYNDIIVLS